MVAKLMSGLRSTSNQTIILFLGLLFYLFLARPVEAARDIAIMDNLVFIATGVDGVRIVDMSLPNQLPDVGHIRAQDWRLTDLGSGPANHLFIQEQTLFVASGPYGVRVMDMALPTPNQMARINTPGSAQDVVVEGSLVYVADYQRGLRIYDWAPGKAYKEIGSLTIGGRALRLEKEGNWIFLADNRRNLYAIDVTNPQQPRAEKPVPIKANVLDLEVIGNRAFLAADTRGLVVLNVSDPANMIEEGAYDTLSASSIQVEDRYGYLVDGADGLIILDLTNPADIRRVGVKGNLGDARRVVLQGDRVVVASGFDGVHLMDSKVLLSPEKVGETTSQLHVEGVTRLGDTLYISTGERGIRVLNIKNRKNPYEVAFLDTDGSSAALTIMGDAAYVADRQGGLLVLDIEGGGTPSLVTSLELGKEVNDVIVEENQLLVADGNSGFRLLNLDDPYMPVEVGALDTPGFAQGVAGYMQWAYVADGAKGLRIIDLSVPEAPAEVGALDTTGEAIDVSLMFLVEKRPGDVPNKPIEITRVIACVADGAAGLQLVEVTDPQAPRLIGALQAGGSTNGVIINGTQAYVALGLNGVAVAELADPQKPRLLGVYDTPDVAVDLVRDGTLLYVADSAHGVRVVDISNVTRPTEIGAYDAPSQVLDVVTWGNAAYVVDGIQGLWVWDITDKKNPKETSFYPVGQAFQVTLYEPESVALIAAGSGGLNLAYLDGTNPPTHAAIIDTPGTAHGVSVLGDYAFVADGDRGLQIIDIFEPNRPSLIASYDTQGFAYQAVPARDYVFIADGVGGLHVVKVADPSDPTRVNIYPHLSDVRGLTIIEPYAYVAAGKQGLRVLDISKPAHMEEVAVLDLGNVQDIKISPPYAFVASADNLVTVLDISTVSQPVEVGRITGEPNEPLNAVALDVVMQTNENKKPGFFYLFIANQMSGLQLYKAEKQASFVPWATYATPGTAWPLQMVRGLFGTIDNPNDPNVIKAWRTLGQFVFGFALFGFICTLGWLALVACYVLPVKNVDEWNQGYSRLSSFFFGLHGLAAHIREGKIVLHPGEANRTGPGVVIVDLSSAVVLTRRVQAYSGITALVMKPFWFTVHKLFPKRKRASDKPETHVKGPGLIFTEAQDWPHALRFDEQVRSVVDLRQQFRISNDLVESTTRDGIKLQNRVFVSFTLGQAPDVLLVGYVGQPDANNLRVINLGNAPARQPLPDPIKPPGPPPPAPTNLQAMDPAQVTPSLPARMKRPAAIYPNKIIKSLADDLDQEDRKEVHQYYQRQARGAAPDQAEPSYYKKAAEPPPYVFDEDRVFRAVFGRAYEFKENRFVEWHELPVLVATQLFRDIIESTRFDDIFLPEHPTEYPVRRLKDDLSRKMRSQGVLSYQFVERKDGQPFQKDQPWNEDELIFHPVQELQGIKYLRARGIKVLFAGFTQLNPALPEVRKQLVEKWSAYWEQVTTIRLADLETRKVHLYNEMRAAAQREMVEALRQILDASPETDEALTIRIFQSLEKVASNPYATEMLRDGTLAAFQNLYNTAIIDAGKPPSQLNPPAADDRNNLDR